MAERLRIFLSSPGDVGPERSRAALVIAQLAKDYARFFRIESYLWESEPMLASGHFQDIIEPPSQSNIVILTLWSRLGTNLPERTGKREYKGIDGRVPVTGTEWEFEDALAASRATDALDLLVYRKSEDPVVSLKNLVEKAQREAQWKALEAFWARYFAEGGQFKIGHTWFENLDGFEKRLKADLTRLIERHIKKRNVTAEGVTWLTGNPFQGLQAYDFDHAPVFFGRNEATQRAVDRIAATGAAGRSFLLILGSSGSGKSSLALAGVMPALFAPGVVPGVGQWRRAVVRPSSHDDGPFAALAHALVAPHALPELLAPGQLPADLAKHFAASTGDPAYLIAAALDRLEHEARESQRMLRHEGARLMLVADQLEELYTAAQLEPKQRSAFIACLDGLARSGRVTVVATMRSDYWHRAAETPLLVDMTEGDSRLDLLPPTQVEIHEMIRRPAQAAGIAFEIDPRTQIGLDARLAEEAAAEPGALPLLSYLLDALYRADVEEAHGSVLTSATAKEFGGLKGAIAARAEGELALQSVEVRDALPAFFRLLVQSRLGDTPTARTVPRAAVPEGTPLARLIDVFLDPRARLLVADGDTETARIRVAHEALFRHWNRAVDWLGQNRRDLETRSRLEEAAALWSEAETGRAKRERLLTGLPLAEGRDLAKRWADGLGDGIRDFIRHSDIAARAAGRRAQVLAFGVIATLVVLLAGMSLFVYVAETVRDQALIAQSKFLARDAEVATGTGDAGLGVMLALEALPDNLGEPSRPVANEALSALSSAALRLHERHVLRGHDGVVQFAAFSPDGTRIVTASHDKTARVWDAATGKEVIPPLRGHSGLVQSAAFSPDGMRIVTASDDKTVRVWDAATGKAIAVLPGRVVRSIPSSTEDTRVVTTSDDKFARVWDAATGKEIVALRWHDDAVIAAAVRPNDTWIVTVRNDEATPTNATVRVWDPATGKEIAVLRGHSGRVIFAAFSPDGTRIVTVSYDSKVGIGHVWDAATGREISVMRGHDRWVYSAAFSPDGKRIVTASEDRTARVWDATTGKEIRVLSGHDSRAVSAVFSSDGTRIVTASDDKTARVWDAVTGSSIAVLRGHDVSVKSAVFSPNGTRIVTSGDATARVWDADAGNGNRNAVLRGHGGGVYSAAFSLDGTRIVTASDDKTARVWDAATGTEIALLRGHNEAVPSATFSPNGTRIVTASADKTARVWDAVTGKELVTLRGHERIKEGSHEGWVISAVFSPDGARIVTASDDKTARIWDAATGREIAILRGHDDVVRSAAFSPNGARIVTGSADKTARVWDAATGEGLVVLRGHEHVDEVFHEGRVISAAFSPDGTQILTASDDKTARIWDAATGREIGIMRGHRDTVQSAAFSPDGTRIVTASDKNARVWESVSGKEIAVLQHDDLVSSAAFSPDGTRIVTASDNSTARVWDAATHKEIVALRWHDTPVGTIRLYDAFAAFSPDGTRILTLSKTPRVWLLLRCQALIDAGKKYVADGGFALTGVQRATYFLVAPEENNAMLAIYNTIRPVISRALPQAGDACPH